MSHVKREPSLNEMPPTSTPRSFPSTSSSSSSSFSRLPGRSRPKLEPKTEPMPPATYNDYRLVSAGSGSTRFNVIKFNSLQDIDPTRFARPVKMNRKDPRARSPPAVGSASAAAAAVATPTLSDDRDGNIDGQPSNSSTLAAAKVKQESSSTGQTIPSVSGPSTPGAASAEEERKQMFDAQGKPMVDGQGEPIYAPPKQKFDASLVAPHGASGNGQHTVRNKKTAFKKKTKQVFKISTDTIRLRREERHPWVVESADKAEEWVGRMEDKAENARYCLFVFEDDKDEFEVLDVRRWFKFQPRPKYGTLAADEAEELYARTLKGKDAGRWMMREDDRIQSSIPSDRNSTNPSAGSSLQPNAPHQGISLPTSSRIKRENTALPGWLRRATTVVKIENANMVGSVKREPRLEDWEIGDGDGDGDGRGGRREDDGAGADGDGDADFEDAFSDDDGLIEFDQTDEQENKELEERLKREFRQGNAQGDDAVSDEEDLFGDDALDENGKRIKKALKKHKKRRGLDDSDDEDDDGRNPYASSEESQSSDEEPVVPNPLTNPSNGGPPVTMIHGMHVPPPPPSRPGSTASTRHNSTVGNSASGPTTTSSRSGSPLPSGAAFLAHRATTPNRKQNSSRSRDVSRERSLERERSRSPVPSGANKRKGESDGSNSSGQSLGPSGLGNGEATKKPRVDGSERVSSLPSTGPKEAQVIAYLKRTRPSIGQLISHFKKSLKSTNPEQTAANKAFLLDVVKRVANLDKDMTIVLKDAFAS
ncbi:Transcription initiation factor IIF, large subunit (RAP74) [Phaffia rhodozyma]|uniref:Transcription initiation factor IIF subunit alpha n=1 Tax=Phaffia rhodozyma TaxID=264483 RepID=A0A0F7SHP8_PHARH|nr:Transcription initiation factor IIF, large subunit (RAP74) [Phaffia rhodozyma]